MSKIPGFRSGKTWKKVVASIGYVIIALFVLLLLLGKSASESTSTPSENSPAIAAQTFSLQEIATKNNLSIGELNKTYRLNLKYKYSNGSYMTVNFQSVKATSQFLDFNNIIIIDNVTPLEETRDLLSQAGFFVLYDENGKSFSDINITTGGLDNGDTAIVLYNGNSDLTKYKYLSFGPIESANNQQVLFTIESN